MRATLFISVLAAVATAIPLASSEAEASCGPLCTEAKRAAEAIAEAVATRQDNWCHLPGQSCGKIKRHADALAMAAANAYAAASPEASADPDEFDAYVQKLKRVADGNYGKPPPDNWCHLPGQSCGKIKRAYEDLIFVAREASAAL